MTVEWWLKGEGLWQARLGCFRRLAVRWDRVGHRGRHVAGQRVAAEELRQVLGQSSSVRSVGVPGLSPWRRRILRIDVADTFASSLRLSPTIRSIPNADSPTPSARPGRRPPAPPLSNSPDARTAPAAGHQLAMPPKQRRGRDQKVRPTPPRQQLRQRGQHHPVRGLRKRCRATRRRNAISWCRSSASSTSLASGAGPGPEHAGQSRMSACEPPRQTAARKARSLVAAWP
jgi:hypothetical protein